MSDLLTPHAGFQLTQASDCAIASTEISPAGAIAILEHCWKAAMALLRNGVLMTPHGSQRPYFASSIALMNRSRLRIVSNT